VPRHRMLSLLCRCPDRHAQSFRVSCTVLDHTGRSVLLWRVCVCPCVVLLHGEQAAPRSTLRQAYTAASTAPLSCPAAAWESSIYQLSRLPTHRSSCLGYSDWSAPSPASRDGLRKIPLFYSNRSQST